MISMTVLFIVTDDDVLVYSQDVTIFDKIFPRILMTHRQHMGTMVNIPRCFFKSSWIVVRVCHPSLKYCQTFTSVEDTR